MQIKLPLVFILFLLITASVCAQEATREKPHRYFNQFVAGGLFGEKDRGTSFTFSTFHGMQFRDLRVALGTGYDSYQDWRVLPLYAMVSIDLAKIKSNAIYLSLNGGFGKAWYRAQNEWQDFDANRAFSIGPVVGYRIVADKWNINLSAGYKWQRIEYDTTSVYYWHFADPGIRYSVTQDIERIVVQLGFGLN
jgi:hypothetical protein